MDTMMGEYRDRIAAKQPLIKLIGKFMRYAVHLLVAVVAEVYNGVAADDRRIAMKD